MNVIVKCKDGHISGIFYYIVFIIKKMLLSKPSPFFRLTDIVLVFLVLITARAGTLVVPVRPIRQQGRPG